MLRQPTPILSVFFYVYPACVYASYSRQFSGIQAIKWCAVCASYFTQKTNIRMFFGFLLIFPCRSAYIGKNMKLHRGHAQ